MLGEQAATGFGYLYIHFGLKDRQTGEAKVEEAILKLHESAEADRKEFLVQEYISNKLKVLLFGYNIVWQHLKRS